MTGQTKKQKQSVLGRIMMHVMRNMAIRHKLVSIIMLTCLSALLVAGITFLSYQYVSTRKQMVKTLSTQADMIAANSTAALTFEDAKDAEMILEAFKVQPSVVLACIYTIKNNQAHVFAKYARKGVPMLAPLFEAVKGYHFNTEYLRVSEPIMDGDKKIGVVSVWSSLDPVRAMFRQYLIIIWSVLAVASLVGYLVSFKVQGIISNPILSLSQVANTVSEQKEYSIRAFKPSNDEVGLLIDSFNDMLEQIQQRDVALVGANEKLEARVEERTTELQAANEQLTREMKYRKRVEEMQRERSERVIRHQAALLQLGKVAESDDLEQVLHAMTEEIGKTLNVERAGIWLFDEHLSDTLVCRDQYLLSSNTHENGLSVKRQDSPKYFQAMEASRIVAVDNAVKDERTSEFADNYLKTYGIQSMLDVPIRLHGKLVGALCHAHVGSKREWSLEEQDFTASVADMIVLKLESQERKKAQLALRESEHRYRTLLKNIPQKILYKDLDCRYLLCNESYARDLKIQPDEIFGKTDYDFHPRALAAQYRADDQRIMQSGIPEEIEESYVMDGKEYVVQTLKSPVRDEDGHIIGIFGIFWDITARKQAEQATIELNDNLEKTVQELKRSNKELQDFAYVTAHDLKAPLRAIGTLADWIYDDYKDTFNDQGKDQMNLIKGRVSRMNELIDSILKYSEIGRGSQSFKRVHVDDLMAEVVSIIDPPESIDIIVQDELPVVVCEKIRLLQVFQNLIGNAIKYMDKPQGRIEVGCRDQGNMWEFYVEDNGPGIDAKYHKKVFKMFQTLVPRDEFESTGIGLAVVKKIVELYGGQVWVTSDPGQGSCFHFTLPKNAGVTVSEAQPALVEA